MRAFLIVAGILFAFGALQAQDSTLGMSKSVTEKIKKHKECLQRFEKKDTTDAVTGRKFSVSQSYYFNKETGQLQLIHVAETQKNRGEEVYYLFYNNQLIKVEAIPSAQECKNCRKEFFFWNNRQVCTKGPCPNDPRATVYLQTALNLKARVPNQFPSGVSNREN